jgi:hypothetical protein
MGFPLWQEDWFITKNKCHFYCTVIDHINIILLHSYYVWAQQYLYTIHTFSSHYSTYIIHSTHWGPLSMQYFDSTLIKQTLLPSKSFPLHQSICRSMLYRLHTDSIVKPDRKIDILICLWSGGRHWGVLPQGAEVLKWEERFQVKKKNWMKIISHTKFWICFHKYWNDENICINIYPIRLRFRFMAVLNFRTFDGDRHAIL